MEASVWLSISTVVISSVVAIGVVSLSARYSWQQAHAGRVWDRKAEAYTRILESLHDMELWFSQAWDDEMLRRDVATKVQDARNRDYRSAHRLLKRSITREIWLLPAAIEHRVGALDKVLNARYETWVDDIDAGFSEVKSTIADIAELARNDLNKPIKQPRFQRSQKILER